MVETPETIPEEINHGKKKTWAATISCLRNPQPGMYSGILFLQGHEVILDLVFNSYYGKHHAYHKEY